MRNWLTRLGLTGVLCALAPAAWGLGFGDLEIKSALGQPLRAQIELLSVAPEERESLQVALASPESYQRFGVRRTMAVGSVHVEVVPGDRPHQLRVLLTSRKPIREPFVSLLLEARWAGNRALREYTLLLDPPGHQATPTPEAPQFTQMPTQSATAVGETRRAASGLQQPAQAEPSIAHRVPDVASQAAGDAEPRRYGPVGPNDTLWHIARRTRPAPDITMAQMMVAIYRSNPRQFAGNINALRRGSVLRIPPASEIRRIDATAAAEEVRDQMAIFARRSQPAQRPDPTATTSAAHDASAAGQPAALPPARGSSGSSPSPTMEADAADASAQTAHKDAESTEGSAPNATAGTGQQEPAGAASARKTASHQGRDTGLSSHPSAASVESEASQSSADHEGDTQLAMAGDAALTDSESGAQATTGGARAAGPAAVADSGAGDGASAPTSADSAGGDQPPPSSSTWLGALADAVSGSQPLGPLRLLLAIAILVLIVAALVVLVRRRRESKVIEQSAHLHKIDESAPELTPGLDAVAPQPDAAEFYAVEDMLADADVLMENQLHDEALATLALGLESHPDDMRLLHKRLEAYWRAGARDSFIAEAKRVHPEPDAQSSDWEQVAAWGRELAPGETFFGAREIEHAAGDPGVDSEQASEPTEKPEPEAASGADDREVEQAAGDDAVDIEDTAGGPGVESERVAVPAGDDAVVIGSERNHPNDASGSADGAMIAGGDEVARLAAAAAAAFEQSPESSDAGSGDDVAPEHDLDALLAPEQDELLRMQSFGSGDLDAELGRLAREIPGWSDEQESDAAPSQPAEQDVAPSLDPAAFGLVDDGEPMFDSGSDKSEVDLAAFDPDALSLEADPEAGREEVAGLSAPPAGAVGDDQADGVDVSATEQAQTKLELARVYLDMGEDEMAAGLLQEVQREGDRQQREDASSLLGNR